MRRKQLLVAGAAAALMLGAVLAPAPAYASDVLVCNGTSTVTFSPGIHYGSETTTDIHAVTDYISCLGSATITSGESEQTFNDVPVSCDTIFPTESVAPVDWSNSTSSTLELTGQVIFPQGLLEVIELSGTVSDGAYQGADVTTLGVYAATSLLGCSALNPNGLTSLSGTATLTITPA